MKISNYYSGLSAFVALILSTLTINAQSVVSVGNGSYASQPPNYEYIGDNPTFGTFVDFATNTDNIDVDPSKIGEPIPTNDWWTSILTQEDGDGNRLGGNLWTYPLMSRFTTGGFEVGNRTGKWSTDGLGSQSIVVDYLVTLGGASFTPTKAIAMNWSDWHVDLRAQVGDNSTNRIDVTLAQGAPFVWSKTTGFNPIINAVHAGVRSYYDASGNALSFPATTDRFIIEYDGQLYGIHLEDSITITEEGAAGLLLNNYENRWVVFSALNQISDLNTLHQYAFVRPTNTELVYGYDPDNGTVTTNYVVSTDVITGNQTNVLQGFIPHHYRGNANQFSFLSGITYQGTPRGTLQLAAGNNLSFQYEFNADFLPHFNAPVADNSDTVPYEDAIMKSMIDGYAADVEFYGIGGGTYWGGKYLLRAIKYALMAKETGNENFEYLLGETKTLVYDWLTFTPGETENYYAYYPAWKGLIGFNEEFFSAYFTDNHFHYGYLVHCAALLEILEPGAMDGYWPMITQIIKTYANWDRNDTDHPYFRTFSPWMGHSLANGLGNAIGNNQESTSESMQAWAGMFMTAEMTNDTEMRDAAAFGYLMETRAIADYWYNESGVFDEIGYDRPITGILEMNRYVYGTFFGAQETYIHGIQWLPITPAYGFWNDFLTTNEAAAIVDPIMNNMANDLENGISADWMNVAMGFKLFFDPEAVVNQFDGYWNAASGTNEYAVAHNNGENGLTYYYAHASQNIGVRQSNYRLSLPLSSAFLKNGEMTYVVYNPSNNVETCNVYENGNLVTSFDVPANSLITVNDDGTTVTPPTPPTTNTGNLALNGTADQSTTAFGGIETRAIDGNTNGNWQNGSVTHTQAGIGQWWLVRLDGTYTIGDIDIYNRTNNCCTFRLNDITVTVEDDNENVLWSENITSSSAETLTVNAEGIAGSIIRITQNQNQALSLAEVEVYEYDGEVTPPSTDTSIFIEAEDYTNMSGILTEDTTDDGGGINVGWIDTNDWMEYSVTVPSAGTYTLNVRTATPNAGASANIQVNGSDVGNIQIPATGDWQNWNTINTPINLSAGTQTLRLTSTGNNFNINWLEIENTASKNINDEISAQISLYPNPVVDQLNINLNNLEIIDNVEIMTINGQIINKISKTNSDLINVDTHALASGIYLVRIKSGNQTLSVKKFIK